MNLAVVAAVLAAVASWLALPAGDAELRRLTRRSRLANFVHLTRAAAVAGSAAGLVVWLVVGSTLGDFALPVAVAVGIGVAWGYQRLEPRGVRARRVAVGRDLPLTLDLMAACLDAGAPMRTAVQRVASIGPASTAVTLRELDDAVRLGVADSAAWQRLLPDPVWGPVAADVIRCIDTGAAAREVLAEHATEARAAEAARRVAAARTVGVRSVLPLMVCFLPAFLLVGVVPIVASLVPHFLGR